MNKIDILQKIIDENGSCDWVTNPNICSVCPLSRLKKRKNGLYYSCAESLGINKMKNKHRADEIYMEAAIRLLLDIAVDDMLAE